MLRGTFFEPLLWFVYAAAPVTLLCLLIYVVGQQNYRQSLNDPQIQMAENFNGTVPAEKIDIATSLAPWIAVYDATGRPLKSSGLLYGEAPKMPAGLLSLDKHQNYDLFVFGEDRVTWQPYSGVRQAIIVVPKEGGGFVVAGRNMQEIENRIDIMGLQVFLAWALTLGMLFCMSFVGWFLLRESRI